MLGASSSSSSSSSSSITIITTKLLIHHLPQVVPYHIAVSASAALVREGSDGFVPGAFPKFPHHHSQSPQQQQQQQQLNHPIRQ
jgi:hypothetical protein